MSKQRANQQYFKVTEGEHANHKVGRDLWRIDFERADPDKAGYCFTCSEPVELMPVAAAPAIDHAAGEE